MFRLGIAILVAATFVGTFAVPASAQTPVCGPVGQNTQTVIPGVTLTWDSSFRCDNAPDAGTYEVTVRVTNAADSTEAIRIDTVWLSHTTPRPQRQAPEATAAASGLPLVIAPGETHTFRIGGGYTLVSTKGSKMASLHLRALGYGVTSAEQFRLGINVHLRGSGAVKDGERTKWGRPVGPPPEVGRPMDRPVGPPSEVGRPMDRPVGPPSEVGRPMDRPVGPPSEVGRP